MENLTKNSFHKVTIDGYSSEGEGVCRIGGMVVFVKGAICGETCVIKLLKVTKNIAYGKVEEIIEVSPYREKPVCSVFGKCGGCNLSHMTYDEELRFKRNKVKNAVLRIGGVETPVEEVIGGNREGYRNKVIFSVSSGQSGVEMGFFRKHSHDVVAIDRCDIQHDALNRAALAVKCWMDRYRIKPYDEKNYSGAVRHVFARYGCKSGMLQVTVVTAVEELPKSAELIDEILKCCPETVSVIQNINKTKGNTVLAGTFKTLWGRDSVDDVLCDVRFRLSPQSFYQVNRDQAEKLYSKAIEFAELKDTDLALDLYCGTGTITLCLAKHARHVIGAEIVPEAVRDAKENAKRNGITNAEFICADASDAATELNVRGIKPDVIVVDPPRKGLAADVIKTIAEMEPVRVVYVSCDPGTLARDLKIFGELGFEIEKVQPVDMFPRTGHVETVVQLSRERVSS